MLPAGTRVMVSVKTDQTAAAETGEVSPPIELVLAVRDGKVTGVVFAD
jgi:hypothetical protein